MKIFTPAFRFGLIAGLMTLFTNQATSQMFDQTSAFDTIYTTPDSLSWEFTGMPVNAAFGAVEVIVYFEGDFGASSEFLSIYAEDGTFIGQTQPYFDGSDCMQDSTYLAISSTQLATWGADNIVGFYALSSDNVDFFCGTNHARIRLRYNYCPLGGPVATVSLPQTIFCTVDNPVAVSFGPAGGTLDGPGLSGGMFDPSNLSEGRDTIRYTFTNSDGCTSWADVYFTILPGTFASASEDTICEGGQSTLTAEGSGYIRWYNDQNLTSEIAQGATLTVSPSATKTYYSSVILENNYFAVDNFTANNAVVVDIDTIAGDDRAGIAVTTEYVFMTGDDSTVRYDLDLQNPVGFERADGLFSDLESGDLYTFYNPTLGMPDANSADTYWITELRTLNDDLTLGSTVVSLTDSILVGYDANYNYNSGIFAGYGSLVVFSAPDSTFYAIDITDGVVTRLGTADPTILDMYWSESWAEWGVAEFTASGFSVLYRGNSGEGIYRYDIAGGSSSLAANFTDLSDLASFTIAPWNDRWYLHYEGGGEFGGSSETLLFADALDTIGATVFAGGVGCPAEVTITIEPNPIAFSGGGNICMGDPAASLTATPVGGSFSGTGVSGNMFDPTVAGLGLHYAVYTVSTADCTYSDSIAFNVNCTLATSELTSDAVRMYPNPANSSVFVDLGPLSADFNELLVVDASGRTVLYQALDQSGIVEFKVENLDNGTYVVILNGISTSRKVLVVSK